MDKLAAAGLYQWSMYPHVCAIFFLQFRFKKFYFVLIDVIAKYEGEKERLFMRYEQLSEHQELL